MLPRREGSRRQPRTGWQLALRPIRCTGAYGGGAEALWVDRAADIEALRRLESTTVVVTTNLAIDHELLGRFRTPALEQELFRFLFAPSPAVAYEIAAHPAPAVAIHFRAGNLSSWTDPPRHSLEDVRSMLACARQLRIVSGLPLASEVHRILSASSSEIVNHFNICFF